MTVKTGNPTTDQMFVELSKAVRESFDVLNDHLPAEYVDNRSNNNSDPNQRRTSLQFIHTRHKKLAPKGPSKHEIEKAEKARRIKLYAAQVVLNEKGESHPPEEGFTYEVDEHKQYQRELQFCAGAVRAGWMNFDDVE